MADDTARKDYEKMDAEYMEGKRKSLDEYGSVIMTSSKFLNSARLRDIYAQEGLRKNGYDVPPTYMVYQASRALAELSDEVEIEALVEAEKKTKPDFAAWLDARVLSDFTLDELKGHEALDEMLLLRKGNRLSVMPVAAAEWKYILALE